MKFQNTLSFAKSLDAKDPLKKYRKQFHLPLNEKGKPLIYFCGNSLGLQPKSVRAHIEQELKDWENLGVEGHFDGKNPWYYYHHFLEKVSAKLVGAKKGEVVIMNSLTVNLHLMMMSFYRPTKKRYKILIESPAFPSDIYAVKSQASINGFNPKKAVVSLKPRAGEDTLRTEDILAKIEELGDELALVMFGGVNYYTGQFFELEKITDTAHKVGALAGFDLAHAAGNVLLKLHNWDVDFAVWCSYKYLNSGPGGTSGAFVHQRHGENLETPRLAGWWGNDEKTRFEMRDEFIPQKGAGGWQLSNAQILPMAAHLASLKIFEDAGIKNLRKKADKLTAFMEFIIHDINANENKPNYQIITPKDVKQRGSQLSILTDENGKALFNKLTAAGIVADWREPNVIRIAPVPLYNKFEEVWRFGKILGNG